jgi:DNA-binding CsgD family transcriptional regulator
MEALISKAAESRDRFGVAESCTRLLLFFSSCASVEEICQRLVHDPRFKGAIVGAHLFKVGSAGDYALGASCGRSLVLSSTELTLGNGRRLKFPPLQMGAVSVETADFRALVVPIHRKSVPVAALLLELGPEAPDPIVQPDALEVLQAAGALIIDSKPLFANYTSPKGLPDGFQLSSRHHEILALIAQGLSNRQIGLRLSLSESTVRQENIKIFKYLNVSNRKEAAAAAPLPLP